MTDPGIYDRFAIENFPECFKEYADLLSWDKYWHTTFSTASPSRTSRSASRNMPTC